MHMIVNKDSVANVVSAEVNKSFLILFYYMHAKSLQLCLTFWTLRAVAHLAPLSMGFSRQEYWHGLPFPPPGNFLTQGLNLCVLHCRQILYCLNHQGSPFYYMKCNLNFKSNFND